MRIVSSDPWDFVRLDGSNVFANVVAIRRDGEAAEEFPWVLDFGDRLASGRFFAMALDTEQHRRLLAGDTVECALLSPPEQQADPRQWRGGLAGRASAQLS